MNPQNTTSSAKLAQRLTAALLLLYCLAQTITIVTRIASGTDQPEATVSMALINLNAGWYLASKIANMVAAGLLLAAGALIYEVYRGYGRVWALLAGTFLAVAGVMWLLSSAAGLALAEIYGGQNVGQESVLTSLGPQLSYYAIEPVRAIVGRVGFTAAALGVALLGTLIAVAGPHPRWLGWVGWAVALAMLFIWDHDAALMHRIGGIGLLAWFTALAAILLVKGVAPLGDAEDGHTQG